MLYNRTFILSVVGRDMMMRCVSYFGLFCLSLHSSKAVERCATPNIREEDLAAVKAAQLFRRREGATADQIVIPVCFHIPQLSRDLLRTITNRDLQNELNHLNEAFTNSSCCDTSLSWCSAKNCSSVDTGISFVMATVSSRHQHHAKKFVVTGTTNSTSHPQACISRPQRRHRFSLRYRSFSKKWREQSLHETMKARYRIGNERVLNIYYVYPLFIGGTEVLGYATYPWGYASNPTLDGVVLHSETLRGGSIIGYNEGDTLVHEVGHWLGLFHTFERGCVVGDSVDDTEPERIPNKGCEPELQRDTCPGGRLDPIFNFMDYSSDDCLYEFTLGQVERMMDSIIAYRTPKE